MSNEFRSETGVGRHPFHNFAQELHSSHWLREVTIHFGIIQIDFFALVISKNPREHGVLRQVIISPPSKRIDMHDEIKVGDLPLNPLGCDFSPEIVHKLLVINGCTTTQNARAENTTWKWCRQHF